MSQLATHVPGVGADDNMVYLWDFWWMRHVLSTGGAGFFHTVFQFYPTGADLVLHAHLALNAFVGATLFGTLPVQTALNVVILIGFGLNGFATYLLAFATTSHRLASIAAGVFFAACPSLAGNLYGQFTFFSAWGLPLFALVFLAALGRGSSTAAVLGGLVLSAVAYTDYYYLVYLCVFVVCVLGHRWISLEIRRRDRRCPQTWFDRVLLMTGVLAVAIAAIISFTGGFVLGLGPFRISLTTGLNLRTLAWAALLWWLWRRWRPTPRLRLARASIPRDARMLAAVAGVFVVLVLPLIWSAVDLWRGSHYVSQTYFWRSAPAGVDLGSLVAGNPFNSMWGPAVVRVYAATAMEPFDGPLWLGLVPLVLVATRRSWILLPKAGLWLAVTAVFFIWALGPHLSVFGVNTGLPLPQLVLRFIPILSNARLNW